MGGVALLLGGPYGESVDPATGEVVGRADSQLGATIAAVTFLVMGAPAMLLGLGSAVSGLRSDAKRPAAAGAGGMGGLSVASGGGGAIDKLERLQRLRESGAISGTEFESEKAKILAR